MAGLLGTEIPGPGLTALGTRQAALVPDALADEPIQAVYASELIRTQLTAAPLAERLGLDVNVLSGIHEIAAADLEARSDRDAIRTYLLTVFDWGLANLDSRMPGGDDGHAFFTRFDDSVATMAAGGHDVVAAFSHGAAIRVWVAGRALNVPPSFAGDHELDNTGIVELSGSPEEGWTLVSWQGTPVGGRALSDDTAEDPTGETLEEALE